MTAVTSVTPYHQQRQDSGLLQRALKSIQLQTYPTASIAVLDELKRGAPATRHAGLMQVRTDWVAFLDSDDVLDRDHIEKLMMTAEETGADFVFSHFRCVGGQDPFPQFLGMPWDNASPRCTTITTLVRTELAQSVGFIDLQEGPPTAGEDTRFAIGCMNAGAKIVHRPEITWTYYHHGANTSGQPDRGDAR